MYPDNMPRSKDNQPPPLSLRGLIIRNCESNQNSWNHTIFVLASLIKFEDFDNGTTFASQTAREAGGLNRSYNQNNSEAAYHNTHKFSSPPIIPTACMPAPTTVDMSLDPLALRPTHRAVSLPVDSTTPNIPKNDTLLCFGCTLLSIFRDIDVNLE